MLITIPEDGSASLIMVDDPDYSAPLSQPTARRASEPIWLGGFWVFTGSDVPPKTNTTSILPTTLVICRKITKANARM